MRSNASVLQRVVKMGENGVQNDYQMVWANKATQRPAYGGELAEFQTQSAVVFGGRYSLRGTGFDSATSVVNGQKQTQVAFGEL